MGAIPLEELTHEELQNIKDRADILKTTKSVDDEYMMSADMDASSYWKREMPECLQAQASLPERITHDDISALLSEEEDNKTLLRKSRAFQLLVASSAGDMPRMKLLLHKQRAGWPLNNS